MTFPKLLAPCVNFYHLFPNSLCVEKRIISPFPNSSWKLVSLLKRTTFLLLLLVDQVNTCISSCKFKLSMTLTKQRCCYRITTWCRFSWWHFLLSLIWLNDWCWLTWWGTPIYILSEDVSGVNWWTRQARMSKTTV